MKPKHIRAFEIGRQRFHVTDRGDGTLQVTSIHPYDNTDYVHDQPRSPVLQGV